MGKIGSIVAGAALVAGIATEATILGPAALAAMPEEFTAAMALIGAAGASLVASGVSGLLATPPLGHGVSSQNPVKAWDVAYGNVLVPGTFVYLESNGGILSNGSNTYDKANNQVIMLACHPIKSVDQVRLNGKVIPLGTGGSGAQSTTWSYSPASNQNQTSITSISRAGGVVTLKLSGSLTGQNGLQFNVQHVADNSFNGIFTVTQPNPADASTFTYLCGGADGSSHGGYIYTCLADYKNRVHCDLTSCLGKHTSTFPELVNNSNLWTAAHKNLGKASVYMAYYYDATVFANGLPTSSFVIQGKNDIYDPRISTDPTNAAAHVYTTNAALVIADYLTNKTWGYGLEYGTDIPLAQLIAAANICDEQTPLAAGGTEAQYTINMHFDLTQSRGAVLQDMLNACAGRITIQSGQYIIVPGAWVGPSLSLTQANLIGPIEYKPILTTTDSANGIKGTYTSAASSWQPADIPPYAEDVLHGYASDRWLAADGGVRIWKDVSFPATTSCPTAQRIAKIDLERMRREGRLTLHCNMSAYSAVALDVVDFTYPRYGWNNKTFEVLSSKLVVRSDANGGAPMLGVDLDLAETDATVYNWSDSEELTPADTVSPAINNGNILTGPQFLELESGPTTTYVGTDGVALPRILAAWLTAPDARIQSGGYILIEYQRVGDTFWTSGGQVNGAQTQCYINGVVSGSQYNVQIQGFTANGVSSGWVQAGPVTVSATATNIVASSVSYPDGTPVSNLQPSQAGADVTTLNIPTEMLLNGSFEQGLTGWTAGVGTVAIDTTQSKYGTRSVSVHGGGLDQTAFISLIAGHTYVAQAWVKTNGSVVGNGALGSTVGLTDPSRYVIIQKVNGTEVNLGSTNPAVALAATAAVDWTLIQMTFKVTTTCQLKFGLTDCYGNTTTANATAWFDGVSLEDITGGADVTGSNTALNIVGQGALATLNQVTTSQIASSAVGTTNIIANAVNSQVNYISSSYVNVPQGTETVLAYSVISTNGGYVKVRCSMTIFGESTTAYAYPQIRIYKGAMGGTQKAFYGNVFVPLYITPGGGAACVTIETVDTSPDLAQQYTITAYSASSAMQMDSISLVIENAKV
jgi:hypothetical protein